MRHVTVGKAIDWQQWQLDQSVRSIRMQVDKDGDLYALPVVVIDPTTDSVRAAANVWEPFELGDINFCAPSNTAFIRLTLPDGYDIEIDRVACNIFFGSAAADTLEMYYEELNWGGGAGIFRLSLFLNAVPPIIVVPGVPTAQWIANTPLRIITVRAGATSFVASIITDATAGDRFINFNIEGRRRKMA